MSRRDTSLILFTLGIAAVLGSALWAGRSFADGGSIEITPPGGALAQDRIGVVVMPDALAHAVAQNQASGRAGDDNWVAINLIVGNPSGVRVEVFPYTSGNFKVAVEGVAGEQMLSFAPGGGLRLQFRVAANAKNALYVSPGVDLYISPPQTWYWGHYNTIYYVASDVDVSWLHQFSGHLAYELGLKIGGGVEIDPPAYISMSKAVFMPELSIFTGLRF